MAYKKNCSNCGKEFETNDKRHINCSIKCKNEFMFKNFIKKVENKNSIDNLEKWLYQKYVCEKQTYRWIITNLNINNRTVAKLLKHYKIPIRTGGNAVKAQWATEEKRNARRKPNKYIINEEYTEILIYRKNKKEIISVLIDTEDMEKCKKYHWIISCGYVSAYCKENNKNNTIKMHRYLVRADKKEIVDHVNGNPLDNRKHNLRKCTYTENAWNRKKYSFNKTGCKGVSIRENGKYQSSIMYKGKNIYLGTFTQLEDAIKARKKSEEKYFREFSIYNRIDS
ncbi:TPA: HNH endonuclease [Clostridium botulinum]|nr:HNH endonuclease [Clostridium botulinum]